MPHRHSEQRERLTSLTGGARLYSGRFFNHRNLSEREVCEINFIIKSRAFQYIAAGRKEWLYPEKLVSKSNWNKYGNGFLLMPDPRGVNYKSEIIIGFKDNTYDAFDEYGRKPWEQGYSGHNRSVGDDFATFQRFKGDFAYLFGPKRRGRAAGSLALF